MRFVRLAVATCVVLLAATAAVAQTGGLSIKVLDVDGNPLPTALVTIANDQGKVKQTTEQADLKGIVDFPVLSPGAGYSITVVFPGMATVVLPDLFVKLSQNQMIPVTMQEELVERVDVRATADVIDLEKQESSTRFSDDFISDLPIAGRFYTSVLTLAPGVQDADGDGNPNIHGSRSRDLNTTVNGVSNTDPLTGRQFSRVNTNSIEEMEVITAGAGVEFGRAQGGFARIIQKQGSNTHEGIVEFFFRTSKLDGAGANDESDQPAPEFDSFQPSVQFSGPVIKDTLWYRASYDVIDDEVPVNVTTGIVTTTRNRETMDLQLTWQVSPRNKLQGSFRSDPDEATNIGVSSATPAESTQSFDQDSQTFSLKWTAPYSPKVLVDTTVAWQEQDQLFSPTQLNVPNDCVPTADQEFLREAICFDAGQGVVSGSSNQVNDDSRTRLTMRSQANIFGGRFWGMSHQFKLGFDVENERFFRSLEQGPSITYQVISFTDDDDTGQNPGGEGDAPSLQSFALINGTVAVPDTDDVRATGTNWAMYAEDQFKPMQNMTITAGVRVDRTEITSEGREGFDPVAEYNAYAAPIQAALDAGQTQDFIASSVANQWPLYYTGYESIDQFKSQLAETTCQGLEDNDLANCILDVSTSVLSQTTNDLSANVRRAENIQINNTNTSPFLAISYSPWANNKTIFRASVGRYYNTLPLVIPLQELNPVTTTTEFRASVQDPETCPEPNANDPNPPIVACGQVDSQSISPLLTISTVDRNIETPYQDEFTFKVERELWAETSISLQYINRSFRDQIQDENINLAVGDYGRCNRAILPSQEAIERSQGASTMSCSDLSGTACTFDSDCSGGATCGYFEDVGGDWLQDPYTLVVYPDTDPGAGDGFVDPITGVTDDNCAGELETLDTGDGDEPCSPADPTCSSLFRAERPDKLSDLYLQNPVWGDIFLIGNYNASDYEAVVLEIVRRQYRSWEMNGSYTWSESTGDGEDFFQALGDDPSLRNNVFGFQSQDQTHVVKLNGTAITPWGIRLGTTVQWQSGLPYSLLLQDLSRDSQTPFNRLGFFGEGSRPRQSYITGVRNDQRNDSYWNVDLAVKKELRLAKNMNLQLTAEIFNVLDDDTYIIYDTAAESGSQVNGNNTAFSRFGRSWQVGAKIAF